MKRGAVLALLACAGGSRLFADESQRPPWSGEIGISYVRVEGNADAETIGASMRIAREAKTWKVDATSDYLRNVAGGRTSSERFRSAASAEYSMRKKLSVYGRESYARDPFAGIAEEISTDIGEILKPVRNDRTTLAFRIAFAGVHEELTRPGPDNSFFGARLGMNFSCKLGGGAEFSDDADHVRDFGNAKDWRLGNEAALSASISRIFALKISHQFSYRNEPAPGKKREDSTLLVSFIAKLPGRK